MWRWCPVLRTRYAPSMNYLNFREWTFETITYLVELSCCNVALKGGRTVLLQTMERSLSVTPAMSVVTKSVCASQPSGIVRLSDHQVFVSLVLLPRNTHFNQKLV